MAAAIPYGRHGALPPAPKHTTISKHAAREVHVVETRDLFNMYLLAILRYNTSLTRHS